ncbi:MAG: hypothetical protein WCL50_19600, partial [Spirochaetota bacterium]
RVPAASGPVTAAGTGAEKKKPELMGGMSASLNSAFSSLASAVLGTSEPDALTGRFAESAPRSAISRPIVTVASPAPVVPSHEEENDGEESEAILASDSEIAGRSSPADAPTGGAPPDRPSEAITAFRGEVIARVGRANPLLGSGLASSLEWILDEGRLQISFRNGIEENLVRGEMAILAGAVGAAAGRSLKVELRVASGKTERPSASMTGQEAALDPVTLVERMFRGQRVERKKHGGSNELR